MIAVIDNGGEYSDHSIWFVECPSYDDVEMVFGLVKSINESEDQYKKMAVRFVCDKPRWYSGKPASIAEFRHEAGWMLPDE